MGSTHAIQCAHRKRLLLALFAEMERTLTAERAAHALAVAEASGRRIGRPVAHDQEKIEYAWLLRREGKSLSEIRKRTGIPKTSLHRYLASEGGESDDGGVDEDPPARTTPESLGYRRCCGETGFGFLDHRPYGRSGRPEAGLPAVADELAVRDVRHPHGYIQRMQIRREVRGSAAESCPIRGYTPADASGCGQLRDAGRPHPGRRSGGRGPGIAGQRRINKCARTRNCPLIWSEGAARTRISPSPIGLSCGESIPKFQNGVLSCPGLQFLSPGIPMSTTSTCPKRAHLV